jgi:CBS domain-containing protein
MREPEGKAAADTNLIGLLTLFMDNRNNSIFVVGADGGLEGLVNFDDLRPFLRQSGKSGQTIPAYDIMHTNGYPVVTPDEGLDKVIRRLDNFQYEVPVVDHGLQVGAIRFIAMPGVAGPSLARIPVPALFAGHTCAEIDLRNRYGVTLLLVKEQGAGEDQIAGRVPDATYKFAGDDVMLVIGSPGDWESLQDKAEVAAAPVAVKTPEKVVVVVAEEPKVIEKVHFAFDKSTLTPEAQEILKKTAKIMNENPNAHICSR